VGKQEVGLVRGLFLLTALSWSCGVDHLTVYDAEALSAPERQQLVADASRGVHGVDALVPFLATVPLPPSAPELTPSGQVTHLPRQPERKMCQVSEWISGSGYQEVIEFRRCVLETGEILNGQVAVDLGGGELSGLRSFSFDTLELGAYQLDGFVTLSPSSTSGSFYVTLDVHVIQQGKSVRVMANGGQIAVDDDTSAFQASGIFSDTGGVRYQFNAQGLVARQASCYPGNGILQLNRDGETMSLIYSAAPTVELTTSFGLVEEWSVASCLEQP
jgi:hypothetical protein